MILTICKLQLLYAIALLLKSLLYVIFRMTLAVSLSKRGDSLFPSISFLFRQLLLNLAGAGHRLPLSSDVFLGPLCLLYILYYISIFVLFIIVLLKFEQRSLTLNLIIFSISRHMFLASLVINYFGCYSRTLNS
jgi:hypothetical protein